MVYLVFKRVYLTRESKEFLQAQRHGDLVQNPVKYAFQTCKWRMTSMVFHVAFVTFGYYLYFVWLPTYFSIIAEYHFNVFVINVVAMISCACSALISAHWIDKYKKITASKVIVTFGTIHIVFALISCHYLNNPTDDFLAIIIWLLLSVSYGLYYGPACGIWLINILPDVLCRYSAFGIAYNLQLHVLEDHLI